jgi:CheY-like chemotaxis protein
MEWHDGLVLLVEDDPNDVLLIQRAWRKSNIAAPLQVVADGEAATHYLSGGGEFADRQRYPLPMLVLLDLKLPRKSGFEVLAWLRQQPILRRLPVVILTSSSEPEDINRAYELGANSYLVKPVQFETLQEMMQTVHLYWLVLNEKPQLEDASSEA